MAKPKTRLNWSDLLSGRRIRQSGHVVKEDFRNAFEKDYHRIVASASFRRLQDKTQVFPLDQSDFVRTRLTHSIEVSSLARSLGQTVAQQIYFRGLDDKLTMNLVHEMGDLLLCAGLVHDIGNPPFGHYGETTIRDWFDVNMDQLLYKGRRLSSVLNTQMKQDFLCFEGNAQALRLLSKLHFFKDEFGMNLTLALLNTIMKYPVSSLENDPGAPDIRFHKIGYFYADHELYEAIVDATGTRGCRHPLTFLLEAADDIAYRTHDIEDSYKKGRFTYDQFKEALRQTRRVDDLSPEKKAAFFDHCNVLDEKLDEAYAHDVNKPELYALQNWAVYVQSAMIQETSSMFCDHYEEIMNGVYPYDLFKGSDVETLLQVLGDIANDFVFQSKQIISLEISAHHIIGGLLDMFIPACIEWDCGIRQYSLEPRLMAMISDNYRSAYHLHSKGKSEEERLYLRLLLVTDYICGMTDSFAKTMYQQLRGTL